MACELSKDRKETATHYIGCTGNEYPIEEYGNWGDGKIKHGRKDLPIDEYPYTRKYKVEIVWKCCKICLCKDKPNID